jgi:hypothetical protein
MELSKSGLMRIHNGILEMRTNTQNLNSGGNNESVFVAGDNCTWRDYGSRVSEREGISYDL